MFVLYHDPALTPQVPHSLGLTKGLIGVVYAFATPDMDGENAVVIAHVRDIAVDRIGRCIDRTLSGDNDFRHASLSITASQCTHLAAMRAKRSRQREPGCSVCGT